MPRKGEQLVIGGHAIQLSNLDKVLYPGARFRKADVINYYIRVADALLPHLKDRPVTLKRFPNGVRGEYFYEKDAPGFTPEWVRTFPVPRRDRGEPDIRFIIIDQVATLVWLSNLANLEIHPFLHRVPWLDCPTSIVFDCDPGPGADILTCARVAMLLRDLLAGLGLESFPKVSGSKGLQVYVPLNMRVTYQATSAFARAVADLLAQQNPDLIVSRMARSARARKVFIDWSQNADFKSTVSVYSLRAKRNHPLVSVPVDWSELETAIEKSDGEHLAFDPEVALSRIEQLGDLFNPVLTLSQELPQEIATPFEKEQSAAQHHEGRTDHPKTAVRRSRQGSRRRFIVRRRDARPARFELMLEIDDALKSWSLAAGLPRKRNESRTATKTPDNPLESIEKGAGPSKPRTRGATTTTWDAGTYDVIEGNYSKGFFRFFLNGARLSGEWTLSRTGKASQNKWQLEYSEAQSEAGPVRSRKEESKSRVSRRLPNKSSSNVRRDYPDLRSLPAAKMTFVEPMLAKLVNQVPEGESWIYEIKLDGYRALAMKTDNDVTLFSRRGNRLNSRFPTIAGAFDFMPSGTIVDGEIVAMDEEGRPSFSTLQNSLSSDPPLYYYVFDVLAYRGKDTKRLTLHERRALLEHEVMASAADPIRTSPVFDTTATQLLSAARETELEGVIAKRRDCVYEPATRSGAWVKYKTNQSQELVIGGYMPGPNAFEYLLAGYYQGTELIFVAKIKNGFTPALRRSVAAKFKGLDTPICPFSNLPEPQNARRGEALTAEVMKRCRWLKPKLVAQIEFTEWTSANHLRHSKFAGLRDDKDPRKVTREVAA